MSFSDFARAFTLPPMPGAFDIGLPQFGPVRLLSGRSAVVTGSTSGIGLAIARALASCGANVMLNGFGEPDHIESLIDELTTEYRVRVSHSDADVSRRSEVIAMVERCNHVLGSVDILVNNAGIQYTAPVEDFPPEKWDRIIAVNLTSNFHAVQAALPHMKRLGWGRIVNVASAHGLVASVDKAAYVAAKHGVIGLTKTVALETARTAITCNAICPGWVLTSLIQRQIDDLALRERLGIAEARTRLLAEKQPSMQFVAPEQIGALTLFLCSQAASQIRGACISMDGGWIAQ